LYGRYGVEDQTANTRFRYTDLQLAAISNGKKTVAANGSSVDVIVVKKERNGANTGFGAICVADDNNVGGK